jgi:hypothetical protein
MSYPPPPPPPPNYVAYASPPPMVKDEEHLRLLAMFHYIYGALVAVLSSFGLIHLIMGIMMLRNPNMFPMTPPGGGPPFPFNPAYMFIVMGGMVVALGWTMGTLSIISGRCISFRRARTLSMIVAGINCIWIPFGTIIGVFTLVVLLRQSVAAIYDYNRPQARTY